MMVLLMMMMIRRKRRFSSDVGCQCAYSLSGKTHGDSLCFCRCTENFMFFNKDEHSPLKAIDFGLAVFYEAGVLPLTGLNLEGTPWYGLPPCQ
jgi:hypothetical protein